MNDVYKGIVERGIEFGNLGSSTEDFLFFVKTSLTSSITESKKSDSFEASFLNICFSLFSDK
jgi:hypothetical protein